MKKFPKSNIILLVSLVIAGLVIVLALYFSKHVSSNSNTSISTEEEKQEYANNVSVVGGKQIIRITAKGGFSPIHSIAQAGLATILRVDTNGTFDCSSIVRIPSMNISKNLPMSGTTDIDIGIQKVGKFYGTCGMGMYPFDVEFK